MIPSPMLMRGFGYPQHCPYPTGLFNHGPQSCRLGITSAGDYIFSRNVVFETLRVVNQARGSHHKPPALAVGECQIDDIIQNVA